MNRISERLYDSTAQQLLALMRQGASRTPTWSDAELSAVLRYQLAHPLSKALIPAGEAGSVLASPAAVGRTVQQLLTSLTPDLELLRAVRRSAKASRRREGGALPGVVATVLYYTAIAAALVRCDAKITSLSDRKMHEGLKWSASRPWVDGSVRAILEEAIDRTATKKGRT